jgi:hypothetical protein
MGLERISVVAGGEKQVAGTVEGERAGVMATHLPLHRHAQKDPFAGELQFVPS